MAKAAFSAYLLVKHLLKIGEKVHFSTKKSTTNFGLPFCFFPFPFLASKWPDSLRGCHLQQRSRQRARESTICERLVQLHACASCESQKPGDHPNFRKNALEVKGPFSELSESSGVFSEQLSKLEKAALGIRNSILGMASHDLINTKPAILGAIPAELPRTHPKDFHLPLHSRSVFSRIGVVPAHQKNIYSEKSF